MKEIGLVILALTVIGGLIVGGFYLKRTVNYKLFYQDNIVKEIKAHVKTDCLKNEI